MQRGSRFGDKLPQRLVEIDQRPPPVFPVKQIATGNHCAEHLLQTQRLCAKLNFIRPMGFRFATLVFHRDDALRACRTRHAYQI